MVFEPLPVQYRKSPDAIASFDFQDIANGTGMVEFLLSESETSAGKDYHLNANPVYSNSIKIVDTSDLDFDLTPFSNPRTIEGVGIINIPFGLTGVGGAGTMVVTCTLRKWDGSSETDIVAVTSTTKTVIFDAGAHTEGVWNLPITIPSTLFKKGETLRLTVDSTITGDTANGYGIDPKDRVFEGNSDVPTTISSILIPFKLDL